MEINRVLKDWSFQQRKSTPKVKPVKKLLTPEEEYELEQMMDEIKRKNANVEIQKKIMREGGLL